MAHFIAGVLSREDMIRLVGEAGPEFDFLPGDRVQTLRGRLKGVMIERLQDGRIKWQPDDGGMPLISLPETLKNDQE